ncbi:MAG: biotin/lipoyl-containing protein [Bacteroidota bacterium]
MEPLILKIDDKEFTAEFVRDDHVSVWINGKKFQIELLKKYSENIFSFAVDQKLMQVQLDFDNDDNLLLSLDGLTYEISITNETKRMLAKFIHTDNGTGAGGNFKLKAPMPGMIVKILVDVGTEVSKGDKLVIIEAMKMENSLTSPVAGIIKSLNAKEGTAVEKGVLLMEIENH